MHKNNLALIDADSIIWIAGHSYKDTEKKTLKGALDSCDDIINDILSQCEADYYAGFLTEGSFRYKIATVKPYKGNRTKMPKPEYFHTLKSYLIEKYKFQYIRDYEADDLCLMAHHTYNTTDQYNPIVASPDKDLRQIAGTFYDYKKKVHAEVTKEEASRNLWMQMLVGDTGDNIAGLPGIGEAKAPIILGDTDYHTKVLNAYISLYGETRGIKYFYETYRLVKMEYLLNDELYYPNIIAKQNVITDNIETLFG